MRNGNIFILNLIALLHYTKYKLHNKKIGHSIIECHIDKESNLLKIFVVGIVELDKNLTINFKILETNLLASNFVSDKILNNADYQVSNYISLPENIDIESGLIVKFKKTINKTTISHFLTSL